MEIGPPTKPIPTIKYCNISYWPMGYGQLTKFGMKRHYNLGQWLRKRYNSLLSTTYNANEIYVRSTDADRALMSAYSNLAGLYPPQGSQVWDDHISWQPIPVHTIPREIDDVIVEKRPCPKYDALLKDTIRSDYFGTINDKHADLYETMSKLTGIDVKDISHIKLIRTTLYCFKKYNTTYLPEWEKDLDWPLLDDLSGLAFRRLSSTPSMKRLRAGPFFYYLFEHLDNSILSNQTSPVPKMLMISAHDTSLSEILNSVGAFDGQPPDFAATALWELKKRQNGEHFVNLYYKSDTGLEKLKIRGCDIDCSYQKFKNLMKHVSVSIEDWERECHGFTDNYN